MIGKGSFAKVTLVRQKDKGELFALKSMKKKYIEKQNQVKRIMTERDILVKIKHPFLIQIHSSFQDEKKLYLVLEYCPGGELFGLLHKKKKLTETAYPSTHPAPASTQHKSSWPSSTYTPKTSSIESKHPLIQPQTIECSHRGRRLHQTH